MALSRQPSRLRLLPPPGPPAEPPDDAARPSEPDADPESVARAICLRLLTARPCTRAELAKELRRRNVPADAADTVLARFDDVGLIDDRAFAASYVERRQRRGLSRRALATELRRKGVGSEEADEAVSVVTDDDERALARALVERRLPSTRSLPYDKAVARLVGMLARKGYGAGLAYSVVREALGGSGGQPDPDDDGPYDAAL